MKNSFKLVFSSKNRLRYRCNEIIENGALIKESLSEIDGVFVNISKYAKSISISGENVVLKKLEIDKILSNLKTSKPQKPQMDLSKKRIYTSVTSLAFSFLFPNATLANKTISYFSCYDVLKEGFFELKDKGVTSKVLEALAVLISLLRRDYLAANGTNTMLSIGEYIEEMTSYKSDDLIKALAKPTNTDVWVEKSYKNGKTKLVKMKSNELKIGDVIVVGAGDSVAADGDVLDCVASVNQVSITGEAEPIKKERGDKVISGSVVIDGRIKVWAEKVGAQSTRECIKTYIEESLKEKSLVGQKAYKMADKLVPVTLGLGGLSYALSGNTQSLASVLQADYSCALKLATPVAFKSSISKAGKQGILLKGSKALESLANVDTFVFDKTGTLTYGDLKVQKVVSFVKDVDDKMLLNLTASAEEHYFHPVAEAIVNAAKERGFSHINHDEVEFIVAHGVKTSMNDSEVIIGSRHFLEDDEGVDFKAHEKKIKTLQDNTLLYIARDKELLGVIALKDELRVDAKECILRLKKAGVKNIVMLTGDVKSRALEIAQQLGIDSVYSDLLPTDKATIIQSLKDNGARVAFVGDGINDAPSLSKSDVGFCMQKGADIAKVTSDIRLLKDEICGVALAKEIANQTMNTINKNFSATVWINSAILLGATFGKLSPFASAIAHNGTTILLLLNALKGRSVF